MKDLYASHVNQRIQSGNLPYCILRLVSDEVICEANLFEKARLGLSILQDNPAFLFSMVRMFSARAKELSYVGQPELYEQDINFLINSDYVPESFNVNGAPYKKAIAMLPFVTFLDKALWYGIYAYDIEITWGSNKEESEKESLFYAWIYILKKIQQKELYHGKTINLSAINKSTLLFELFCGDSWDGFPSSCFANLSTNERMMFERLIEKRDNLRTELQAEISIAKLVAAETQAAWEKFIEIVNDLSLYESGVISHMIDTSLSKREKLGAIEEYTSALYRIGKGHYQIEQEDIPLLHVFESVLRRFEKAPSYCMVQDSDGISFRVFPLLLQLLMQPETYNYLYIVYHQFRLDPRKDNAKRFAELALSCLKRNLGIVKTAPKVSVSDIVEDFYTITTTFVEQHREAIEKLSFDTLQQDSILNDGTFLPVIGTEKYEKHLADQLSTMKNDSHATLSGLFNIQSREQIASQLERDLHHLSKMQEAFDESIVARQIVVSLNIIYMFCSALRIMLTNKRAHVEFRNRDKISNIRYNLLDLDNLLVRKVYSNPSIMIKYRESTGIVADTISELESQEEEYRYNLFSSELRDIIEELTKAIEAQSIDSILDTKKKIQSQILQHPVCEHKEKFAEWLDSISDRICAVLVNNCQSTGARFDEVKQTLLTKLGPESRLLPLSTLSSLTTAEILYEEYASRKYAEKGFDYSCISALYYQSFEEAYNKLIWCDYAKRLNSLQVDEKSYIKILDEFKGKYLSYENAKGYLDADAWCRSFYIDYKSRNTPVTSVKLSCVYGSFAKLMKQVLPSSKLDKFCDYFAEIAGYPDKQSMFADVSFMENMTEFAKSVENSKGDRNNASHGGSAIDIVQCDADKKAVLNGLEVVRKESIGLIQQLLYLMRNRPQ